MKVRARVARLGYEWRVSKKTEHRGMTMDTISWSDFQNVELRIGAIIAVRGGIDLAIPAHGFRRSIVQVSSALDELPIEISRSDWPSARRSDRLRLDRRMERS